MLSIGHALALSQSESNMLQNAAMLSVANKWCKNYVVDLDGLAEIITSRGVNPAQEPYKTAFQAIAWEFEEAIGRMGVNSFCSKAYERYKNGGPISGFIAPK